MGSTTYGADWHRKALYPGLGFQIVQSSSYLSTLGPKLAIIHVLGALLYDNILNIFPILYYAVFFQTVLGMACPADALADAVSTEVGSSRAQGAAAAEEMGSTCDCTLFPGNGRTTV